MFCLKKASFYAALIQRRRWWQRCYSLGLFVAFTSLIIHSENTFQMICDIRTSRIGPFCVRDSAVTEIASLLRDLFISSAMKNASLMSYFSNNNETRKKSYRIELKWRPLALVFARIPRPLCMNLNEFEKCLMQNHRLCSSSFRSPLCKKKEKN